MMELASGKLADGQQLVSETNLLERRKPNVVVSAGVDYGMGLIIDKRWGVTVVHHGGDLAGYHSDMMWLPEYNVGAVILTNSDTGYALRGPFLRRLVELLFDGKAEAAAQLTAAAADLEAERAKARERLQVPAEGAAAAALAAHYRNAALGGIGVSREGSRAVLQGRQPAQRGRFAQERRRDDQLHHHYADAAGAGVRRRQAGGKRTLIVRDAQHEYVFTEQK